MSKPRVTEANVVSALRTKMFAAPAHALLALEADVAKDKAAE